MSPKILLLCWPHTHTHTHTHKVHAGDIILLIISTCHFSFTVLCSLVSVGVWLASKNEVLRYIDEAELPKCVNKDCDTSTEDNVRIRILKLVFTFKHNGVSIYSMKCFKINKELTFIITCIHLDHCATWVQHEFSSTRIARSRKLHLGNTVMASEKIWWILIDGSYNLFIGKY